MSKRKRRLALDIDELAAGGDGVGRDDQGRVTFVPHGVPGDRVLVELLQERKQFARGRIAEVLEPSEHRQQSRCQLFAEGSCGGCQWQEVAPSAQRAAKEAIVDKGLRRALARGMSREELIEPCEAYGWRRRARLSYWAGGPRVLGFFPPKSSKITDVVECPQLESDLQLGLALVRKHLLPALRQRGEIELLLGQDGRCHVVVHGTVTPKGLESLAAEERIAGVRNGATLLGEPEVVLEGGVVASASHFAQASRAGNEALCGAVAAALGSLEGLRVLELYAGSGNFTRLLAGAGRVVAIEQSPAPKTPVGVDWRQAEVCEELDAFCEAAERFDLVLLDPPRTGARDAIPGITALAPSKIVYVSCDVATLARDVEMLHELGYEARSAQPIDLMPQTSHVEVVLVLEARR